LAFEQAVKVEPRRVEAHTILGSAYLSLGRCTEACECFETALALRPGDAPTLGNLARALRTMGRTGEAVARFRESLAAEPHPGTHSNLLYTLQFDEETTPEEVYAEHRRWNTQWAEPLRATVTPVARDVVPGHRLRIGYLSADLKGHAVACFFEPVLEAHDRSAFEVFCYADVRGPDATTERLRAKSEHWVPVTGLSDDALADRIRHDGIDLLFDLAGHTGQHRLAVFARRPAPVQLTWIGYPNTTGLDAMDHRITDAIADPPGASDSLHCERLLRLPETFSCYRPPDDAPVVAPLPARAAGFVTFGCFNNPAKLGGSTLRAWGTLLGRVAGSRLHLRGRAYEDAATVSRVRELFAVTGVDPMRVDFDPRELSVRDHLKAYARVDVALDPFPYNGTTTTCEALWMGVPVLTIAGASHAGRVGASLLTHVGLPEWIAPEAGLLAGCGAALVADLTALESLRAGLRARVRVSPLCDAPRFVRHLEQALLTVWRERRATP
ncbi:MAG: tetratricopeptide repeat protein, partial [Deltaproteobacteria bacterium]